MLYGLDNLGRVGVGAQGGGWMGSLLGGLGGLGAALGPIGMGLSAVGIIADLFGANAARKKQEEAARKARALQAVNYMKNRFGAEWYGGGRSWY